MRSWWDASAVNRRSRPSAACRRPSKPLMAACNSSNSPRAPGGGSRNQRPQPSSPARAWAISVTGRRARRHTHRPTTSAPSQTASDTTASPAASVFERHAERSRSHAGREYQRRVLTLLDFLLRPVTCEQASRRPGRVNQPPRQYPPFGGERALAPFPRR